MNPEMLSQDEFTIWQPSCVEIVKGSSDTDRRIGGFCSTEHLDRQGEVVLQRGLDFDEFVQYGYYNDNHSQATSAVVGVPEKAEYVDGNGWYTEGHLLKGFPRADEIWSLAKSLEGTKRKLGFSIEGKVLERRDNYITKAKIRNVAVTNSPVNTNCTWSALAKSFHPEALKALQVGDDRVASRGGRVLTPEDLERGEIKNVYQCPHKPCAKVFMDDAGLAAHIGSKHGGGASVYARKARVFDVAEAVKLLKSLRPGYSTELCRKIVLFTLKGA